VHAQGAGVEHNMQTAHHGTVHGTARLAFDGLMASKVVVSPAPKRPSCSPTSSEKQQKGGKKLKSDIDDQVSKLMKVRGKFLDSTGKLEQLMAQIKSDEFYSWANHAAMTAPLEEARVEVYKYLCPLWRAWIAMEDSKAVKRHCVQTMKEHEAVIEITKFCTTLEPKLDKMKAEMVMLQRMHAARKQAS